MEAFFAKISFPARNHIYVIVAYSIVVFGMNFLGNRQMDLFALAPAVATNIAVFYSLNAVGNNFFTYGKPGRMAVQLVALIVMWYVVVYLFIYELFPTIGQKLFGTDASFHVGKYIRNVTAYLEKSLLAVVIYQLAKVNKARQLALLAEKEKTIAKERQLKVAAENQLVLEREAMRIDRENIQLRFTVQSAQLKSHWLHSVTMKVREKIVSGDDTTQLFDAYQGVLNYYYRHGGPDNVLVTLREECHLIRLMKLLNEELNNGKPTLQVAIKEPLTARQLPPFVIATLLENAFKFGDQSDLSNPILLTVSSLPKRLTISCWNRIDPARATAAPKSGIGLTNIQQQLDYLAPDKNNIAIENDHTAFQITITVDY